MIPGKLYRLKNCGWYVFNCNGKLYSVEDGEIIMFIKQEPIDGVYDGTGPYATLMHKLFFLHGDRLLETTDNRIGTNITKNLELV